MHLALVKELHVEKAISVKNAYRWRFVGLTQTPPTIAKCALEQRVCFRAVDYIIVISLPRVHT